MGVSQGFQLLVEVWDPQEGLSRQQTPRECPRPQRALDFFAGLWAGRDPGRREETCPTGVDLPFEVSLPVPCHFGEGSGLAEG